MTRDRELAPGFERLLRASLVIGVLGIVASIVLAFFGLTGFFQSYLYAYLFWFGLSAGCFVLLLVQHLAGGSWGALIRRPLEAGTMVLPLMALLFIPVLFGIGYLYEWSHADVVALNPLLQAKEAWLNVPFFIIRTVLYFAIWLAMAFYYTRLSDRQDRSKDLGEAERIRERFGDGAGPGIVVFILTMTFAVIDWGMSLSPEWFSGIYGVIFMIGQAITAVAFIILLMVFLARNETIDRLLNAKRLQDLGNFLMAFTLFWAYVSFAQLIIIWSNNTIETSPWYAIRLSGGWNVVALFLLAFHFALPFLILFSRWVKRKRRALVVMASWMLLMRLVDLFWIIVPAYDREIPFHALDAVALIGIGGLWLAAFVARLRSRPLLPLHDPRLTADPHPLTPSTATTRGAEHA